MCTRLQIQSERMGLFCLKRMGKRGQASALQGMRRQLTPAKYSTQLLRRWDMLLLDFQHAML